MSRSIAVAELKRQKAERVADIAKIDSAIEVLESGIVHRVRTTGNGKPKRDMSAAHAALAAKRAAKKKPASIAEVAE